MADEIKLKAPTVEQQVVVNINGEDKLKSFADTLDKISNNKNLQKYWKTQQDLINATADAYSNFQKKASKDNASELIKVTNALKAMSGTDLSHIIPDFDKISKSMTEAQKVAGNIDSAFSVKGFKEAFDSFETLKAYGTDVQKLFSHFGVSSDIGELQQNVRLLEGEVEKLTRRLSSAKNANEELRNEFENFKVGSGFADKLDELDRLKAEMQNIRDEATQTFNQFLDANKIDRYDWFSDDRFAEYFEKLENGTLTATDAIRRFKSEYSYLLEDSYKSSGDSFGLDQLQAFSTKLDSIFHQVEETSNKINDILSNGVIAKSMQNLSEDTTLSDSQRSIFGNILQDEESLKSITALFQKLIDETNQTKNTEVFNTEQFTKIESLFTSIESSLSSIKGVLVDVGDGEELSPLLKQLDNIREATSNIKLSLNLDLGNEVSERLNQKVSQSTQRQLEAYRKLFSVMKGTGKTNKEMLKFFEPDEASATELIGAYQGIIKRAEEKFKVGNSNIYKKLLGSTYDDLKKEIKNANAQLGRAENKRSENGILGDLFGNTKDLSGVIEQLNTIVSKLDEISNSAQVFSETFKDGLNVNASVEEIEKLTNRVKELESELVKIKTPTTSTPQESNISSGNTNPPSPPKKDRYAKRRKISEEDFLNYSPNRINEKLSNSGYTILGETVNTELVDGLVKVSAKIKDADGAWKSFSAKVDADGNIFEQRFKTVTNGVDKLETALQNFGRETAPALTYQETLDKAQKIKNSLNLGDEYSIKVDSSEFVTITKKLTDVENTGASVTQTFKSAQDAIDNFGKSASNSAEKTSVALKSVKSNIKEVTDESEKLANAQKEQNVNVNLNKYDKRLDSYNGKVDKYKATIGRFNDGGWTSKTYLENVQAVRDAVKQYATLLDNIKTNQNGIATDENIQNLDKYEKKIKDTIATVTNMSAAEKGYNFVSAQKELDKIHKILDENTRMSSSAKAKIKAYYKEIESGNPSMSLDRIHGEIMKIYNAEVEAGRAGRSFFDTLKNSGFHQLAAQMAGMFGFYDVINVIKQAASTVTELNTQITELAKVSEQSSKQIYADFDSYADIAKEVRGTISDTIAATADWSKNGYSIPDAKQLAEISQLYKNVGDGIDIDAANESLISTLKGFQLEADQAEHIVDVFNEVDLLASYYSNVIALCIYMHIDSNYIG
nr:MAG TPA: minor tail protein [Caudoviricetes sp.]